MKLKLLLRAGVKLVMGFALLGTMLFLSAGTLQFANAWVFLIALFVPKPSWLRRIQNKSKV